MRRVTLSAIALSVLIVATLTACSDEPTSILDGPPISGVRGVVTTGPQCPVVVQGSPCPDRPWQGTVRITASGGEVVGVVKTDRRGRFEVPLSAGAYELIPETELGRLPTALSQSVTIERGEWVEVTLTVDTGIR